MGLNVRASSIPAQFEVISALLGGLGALLALAILAGWAWDIPWLTAPSATHPPMRPLSAVCHLLTGLALMGGFRASAGSWRWRIAQVFALIIVAIGSAVLLEYLFGWDLTIDRWLFPDRLAGHWRAYPGRPAPQSALSMALVGAILVTTLRTGSRGKRTAEYIALGIVSLAYLALMGYAYDLTFLYYITSIAGMSLYTAVLLILFCSGILLANPLHGLIAPLAQENPGGSILRYLIPAAILVPPIIGWLNVMGAKRGLYEGQVGAALTVVVVTAAGMMLIWSSAGNLNREDSKRRQAEELARRNLAMLQAEQEAAPDGVLVVDEHQVVVGFNQRFIDQWQIPLDLTARKSAWALLDHMAPSVLEPPDFHDRVRYLYTHPTGVSREEIHLRDGRILDSYSAPVLSLEGAAYGRVWFYRDNTELRGAIKQVMQKTAELASAQELGQLKDDFISSVSHELKTPLSIIIGYAELMEENDPNSVLAKGITAACKRLTDHINNLLDYSALLAGSLSLYVVDIDLAEVVRYVEDVKVSDLRQDGRSVEIELAPDLPQIRGDFRRISQMLFELLTNAAKFTPPEGVIGIRVYRCDGQVCLEVWDTGPGLSQAEIARLYAPFTHLEIGDAAKRGGLGLGLAIVMRLANLHGGTVQAESRPAEGSHFTIKLPIEGPAQASTPQA